MPSGTSKEQRSYIHVRITPTPALNMQTRDLMHKVCAVVRAELGDTAEVSCVSSMSPIMRNPEDPL